jgi:hypothetical protein
MQVCRVSCFGGGETFNVQNSMCQKPSPLTDLRIKAGRDELNVPQGWIGTEGSGVPNPLK